MFPPCDIVPYTTVLTAASHRRSTINNCMEASMRDIILLSAGVAGIVVAIIHGVLVETKVFAKATIQPESLRTLIRIVWQAGAGARVGRGRPAVVGAPPGSAAPCC